ncbi:MAG: relaxase/mobilization nuclease domain-containing protein [Tyzzerella sp.]|nr:relaxase/mobilization nuclease domain-containing protein [Tyzzerella sp.]
MAIIKAIKSGYKSPEEMNSLIQYIISEERHVINGLTGGRMIMTGSSESVYQQMMECKQYFHKVCGRYMRHIIVSFSNYELQYLGVNEIYKIAMQICGFFRWNQTVFAIHQETEQIHIHIGINTVSFLDGSKLRFSLWELKTYVNRVVGTYVPVVALNLGIQEVKMSDNIDELLE